MIKLSKTKNGNIKGSFEKDGQVFEFTTQATYHQDNKAIVTQFIKDVIKTSSSEHILKELTRCDDRLLAYYQ